MFIAPASAVLGKYFRVLSCGDSMLNASQKLTNVHIRVAFASCNHTTGAAKLP